MEKPIEKMSLEELGDVVCPFKPHRGQTFREIRSKNPGYLSWLRRKKILNRDKHRCLVRFLEHPEIRAPKVKRKRFWRSRAADLMRGL